MWLNESFDQVLTFKNILGGHLQLLGTWDALLEQEIFHWGGYGHCGSCEQLRLMQVPVRDWSSSSHWMDLDGFNIIQSGRKENTDWEQSGAGGFMKDFFCVCVLFLSTHLVNKDLCSLALQQKYPNLYFAHNHTGWNRLVKLIGLRSQICKQNYFSVCVL